MSNTRRFTARSVCAAVVAVLVLPTYARALYPGDCGRAAVGNDIGTTGDVAASDALAILRGAVGSENCINKICNVDYPRNSIVTAADALLTLKKAVGHNVTLTCKTTCDPDECVCDAEDLLYVLSHADDGVNVPPDAVNHHPPVPAAAGVLAVLHCSTGTQTVISLSQADLSQVNVIDRGSSWLNGYKSGTTQYNTLIQPASLCTFDPACGNASGSYFLKFNGTMNGIVGLTIKGFVEGVHLSGSDNWIEATTFERNCDSAVVNGFGARGNIIRSGVTIKDSCRGVEGSGNNALLNAGCSIDTDYAIPTGTAESAQRGCYHVLMLENTDLDNVTYPLDFQSTGRVLLYDSTIRDTFGTRVCEGPILGAAGASVFKMRIQDSSITKCKNGLALGGGNTEYALHDNIITDNDKRGVFVRQAAIARLDSNSITLNGDTSELDAAQQYYGGVALSGETGETPSVRLGVATDQTPPQAPDTCTATTVGCNTICDNKGHSTANNTYTYQGDPVNPPVNGGPMEIHNGRGTVSATALQAENNYWCGVNGAPTTSEIYGKTDFDPYVGSNPN